MTLPQLTASIVTGFVICPCNWYFSQYLCNLTDGYFVIGGLHCTDLLNRFLILQTSIKTTKQYTAIAAVTTQTLAVGSMFCVGIDFIDLSGRILRQLSKALHLHNLLLISYYLSSSYFQSSISSIVSQHLFNIHKLVALFSYKCIKPFSFLAFLTLSIEIL